MDGSKWIRVVSFYTSQYANLNILHSSRQAENDLKGVGSSP